jgi:GH15 family glucan-1,4-alpha-glucosidase
MCWVALDRLAGLRLVKDADAIARERDAIRADIESQGFSSERNSYVAYYGAEEPDSSLLLLARHGYRAPDDSRMRGTYDWVTRELSRNGFLMRYASQEHYDGIAGGENAFAACSFWAAEYLANVGRRDEARPLFERLARCANDVGLYAEEIVPATGEPIGNFPQAFSHVSLISAAVALSVHKTA